MPKITELSPETCTIVYTLGVEGYSIGVAYNRFQLSKSTAWNIFEYKEVAGNVQNRRRSGRTR